MDFVLVEALHSLKARAGWKAKRPGQSLSISGEPARRARRHSRRGQFKLGEILASSFLAFQGGLGQIFMSR